MALKRENILGLIGSRRYHSAILTTFSFDFYFFEMKAMKWLRSSGVRNINVLIDGHYYAELMDQLSGEEMHLAPGYSLYPIFHQPIFHPKMWMLFGDKEGLLIIGSGNLTNAGNGNNDEIWGAFQFDIRYTENAHIFSSAWQYIQSLCSSIKGLTHEKTTRWILDHSKWLIDLPKSEPFQFYPVAGGEQLALLFNSNNSSIWVQMTSLMANEDVVEITAISPYYDKKGSALQSLALQYPGARINVVIDSSGLVPELLPSSEFYTFYNWYDSGVSSKLYSKTSDIHNNSQLHAKLIHFLNRNGTEYCLFGSANITPEGLGLSGTRANREVSLLIKSLNSGLLNTLGIQLKSAKNLSDFKVETKPSIYETIVKRNILQIRLLSAEWIYDELHLFTEGEFHNPIEARLFDNENRLLQTINIGDLATEIKSKPSTSIQGSHHIGLFDRTDGSSVSNKILLADYLLLLKTHPNPRTEEIERIYNEIQGGELDRVLDLLQFAILDFEEESDTSTNIMSSRSHQTISNAEHLGPDKLYELSSYKPIEHHSIEQNLLMTSLSLRVLDVLKFIKSTDFYRNSQPELRVDE